MPQRRQIEPDQPFQRDHDQEPGRAAAAHGQQDVAVEEGVEVVVVHEGVIRLGDRLPGDIRGAIEATRVDHGDDAHVNGWRTILITDSHHPYMKHWWVGGCVIGYEHTFIHEMADFLKSLETGEPVRPNFRDALETQRVCDAVLKSAETNSWQPAGA